MTYLQFHLLFILPPVLILLSGFRRGLDLLGRRAVPTLLALPLLALVYTTAWDSYLIRREVWWYGPDRVIGALWGVPYEEYAFFLFQPLLTCLVFYRLLAHLLRLEPHPKLERTAWKVRLVGGLVFVLWTLTGARLIPTEPGLYLGLILTWASPVAALMWFYRGEEIWRLKAAVVPAILIPTVYLWVADRVAIGQGIWEISDRYTLGWNPFGLPVEEATFFLVTNVLVVFGAVLFLEPGLPFATDRSAEPSSDPVPEEVQD